MDGSGRGALAHGPGAEVRLIAAERQAWLRNLLVIVCVLAIVCVPCVGAMVVNVIEAGRPEVAFVDPFEPPAPDADRVEWVVWPGRAVAGMLAHRGSAMLEGDEGTFLDVISPNVPHLRERQQKLFTTLRRMGIGRWEETVAHAEAKRDGRVIEATVEQSFCFGGPTCRLQTIQVDTVWGVGEGRLYLTEMTHGVRPWELSEVDVATGERTVVVVASRLGVPASTFLPATEEAARVADTFARWGEPPDRYVVAVAGDSEFRTWYDNNLYFDVAGIHLGDHGGDLMVRYPAFADKGPVAEQELMTHELAHAATLSGPQLGLSFDAGSNPAERGWLVEGIAEYATMVGRPISVYTGLNLVRLAVHQPQALTNEQRTPADYGIWFLRLRWLADTYGEEAMLAFFGLAVHDGVPVDESARRAFGESWTTLSPRVDAFIQTV